MEVLWYICLLIKSYNYVSYKIYQSDKEQIQFFFQNILQETFPMNLLHIFTSQYFYIYRIPKFSFSIQF